VDKGKFSEGISAVSRSSCQELGVKVNTKRLESLLFRAFLRCRLRMNAESAGEYSGLLI